MEFSLEFWLQIGILIVTFIVGFSKLSTEVRITRKYTEQKLRALEKKQEKHNNLIERMVRVEQAVDIAHKRLDELRK